MAKHYVLRTGLTPEQKKIAATLPKMTAKTLKAKLEKKDGRFIIFATNDKSTKEKEKIAKANMAVFEKIYKTSHPYLVNAIKNMPEEGSVLVSDGKGKKVKVPLRDKYTIVRSLIIGRNIAKAKDIYKVMLDDMKLQVSRTIKAKDDLVKKYQKLKVHKLSAKATPAKQLEGIKELLDFWGESRVSVLVQDIFAGMYCESEEGIGRNSNVPSDFTGDMTEIGGAARNTSWNPDGLFTNVSFPLKRHVTCVRNQGNRGTCEVFSLTAAVEALVSANYDKKVNLSEQALQKTCKLDWFPMPFDYGDGGFAILNLLASTLENYTFSFERDWDYNPSYQRVKHNYDEPSPNNQFPPFYTGSNLGYQGLACSDTNHQAKSVCYEIENPILREVTTTVSVWVEGVAAVVDSAISFLIGQTNGHWVEKTVTEWVEDVERAILCEYETNPAGSAGYKVGSFVPFYVLLQNWDIALQQAKFYLDNSNPILLEMFVMPSFDNNDKGYVTDVEPQSTANALSSRGFHCVMIAGYCDNANLPKNAPQGAGGGYFIVKNSYGTHQGDCGFWYLPYQYVANWGTAMTAVTSVNR